MIRRGIIVVLTLISLGLLLIPSLGLHGRLLESGDLTLVRGDHYLWITLRESGRLSLWYRARTPWTPTPDLEVDGICVNPLPNQRPDPWWIDRFGVRVTRHVWDVGLYQKFPDSPPDPLGSTARETNLAIQVPLWMFACITGVYPCVAFIRGPLSRWTRFGATRYRRRHNLCINCAYDLTGNVSGVCPECGTEIEKP